jgi:hypothetical protein
MLHDCLVAATTPHVTAARRHLKRQVDDWSPDLVAIEAKAKEDCSVLLFVIDAETRALVSVLEAVEHVCRARTVVVVVRELVPPTDFESDGSTAQPNELKDLQRLRSYLRDVAVRHGVDMYSDLQEALGQIRAMFTESAGAGWSVAEQWQQDHEAGLERGRTAGTAGELKPAAGKSRSVRFVASLKEKMSPGTVGRRLSEHSERSVASIASAAGSGSASLPVAAQEQARARAKTPPQGQPANLRMSPSQRLRVLVGGPPRPAAPITPSPLNPLRNATVK